MSTPTGKGRRVLHEKVHRVGLKEGDDDDPFDENDDDCFSIPSDLIKGSFSNGTLALSKPISLQSSPVTSPSVTELPSIVHSSSRGSSASSVVRSASHSVAKSSSRSVAKSASRRKGKDECESILRRSIEGIRLSDDIRLFETSIRSLRELVLCGFAKSSHILGTGVIEVVLSTLAQHFTAVSLAEQSCRFLAETCERCNDIRTLVSERGGIQLCLSVIEKHFELYATTIDAGMSLLGAACLGPHVENQEQARHKRGFEWVLVCMRQWRDMRALQASALQSIARMVHANDANRSHVVSFGGLQEVLSTMDRYAEDSAIQNLALTVLSSLSRSSAQDRETMGMEGALEKIVNAVKLFPSKPEVVLSGAKAVRYLCIQPQNRVRLENERGVDAMVQALQQMLRRERDAQLASSTAIVENIFLALSNAVLDNAANRTAACRPEQLNLLSQALRQARGDQTIEFGVRLMRNVTFENRVEFGKASGAFSKKKAHTNALETAVTVVADAMLAHISHPGIAEHGCAMLFNVCALERKSLVLRQCTNAEDLLRSIVEVQPGNDEVVRQAVALAIHIKR